VAAQIGDPGSLWQLYRRLIELRHQEAALERGALSVPGIEPPQRNLVALLRSGDGAPAVLVIANLADAPAAPFAIPLPAQGARVLLDEGLPGPPKRSEGRLEFTAGLAPRGFAFIRLE
jgi:hypothetical protein